MPVPEPDGAGARPAPPIVAGSEPFDSPPTPVAPLRFRYPPELAAERVQGAVTLRVLAGVSGRVEDARVVRSSGHPGLAAASTRR